MEIMFDFYSVSKNPPIIQQASKPRKDIVHVIYSSTSFASGRQIKTSAVTSTSRNRPFLTVNFTAEVLSAAGQK
jgi:hypothetical protein